MRKEKEKAGFELLVSDLTAKSDANVETIIEKINADSYRKSRENPNPRMKLIFDLRNAGYFDLAHKAMDGKYD